MREPFVPRYLTRAEVTAELHARLKRVEWHYLHGYLNHRHHEIVGESADDLEHGERLREMLVEERERMLAAMPPETEAS